MFEHIWSGYLFETSYLVWYLSIDTVTNKVMLKYKNPITGGFDLQMEVSEGWFVGALLCLLNRELPALPPTEVMLCGKEVIAHIMPFANSLAPTTGIITKERQGVYMDNVGAQRLLDAILEWRRNNNGKM